MAALGSYMNASLEKQVSAERTREKFQKCPILVRMLWRIGCSLVSLCLFALLINGCTLAKAQGSQIAELPREQMDLTAAVVTGRSISVPSGADLQAAINTAQPGDELVLQAGATFVGA